MIQEKGPGQPQENQGTNEWREVTDEEWARIAKIFPSSKSNGRGMTDRQVVNALVYRHQTKTKWKNLPAQFGAGTAVAKRISRWKEAGTLPSLYEELENMGLVSSAGPPHKRPEREENRPLEWWELTDEQWASVEPFFPPDPKQVYRNGRYKTNREILNAILYRYHTQTSWRDLPEQFGHWRTVNERYTQWNNNGTLKRVLETLKMQGVFSAEKDQKNMGIMDTEETSRQWWELTDEQWKLVFPLLPQEDYSHSRKKPRPDRQMLNAILFRYRTSTPWRELPEKYGHWRTVNDRYTKWKKDGTLEKIFYVLRKNGAI